MARERAEQSLRGCIKCYFCSCLILYHFSNQKKKIILFLFVIRFSVHVRSTFCKRTIELVTNNVRVNSTDFVKSLLGTSRVFDSFMLKPTKHREEPVLHRREACEQALLGERKQAVCCHQTDFRLYQLS